MTFQDLFYISSGNLWRMKLRTFLTVSGVVIAIAAFVAMVSFGAGNQRLITQQFNELGLFSTMYVYPLNKENATDSIPAVPLNQQAIETLADIPGVNLAYPLEAFSVTAVTDTHKVTTKAQALPGAAIQTKIFSQLVAGSAYTGDSADEAIVTEDFLETVGIDKPDSVIGRTIVLSVQVSSIDSGLTKVIENIGERVGERARQLRADSLRTVEFLQKAAREELNGAMMRFIDGYLNNRATISDTLVIRGVLKGERGGRLRIEPVIIPIKTALLFRSGGFSGNLADLAGAFSQGNIFTLGGDTSSNVYSQVTLDLNPEVPYQTVKDSVEALGFRTFSFAEQFNDIQKFFFYLDIALGLIGLIALVTASLGILNTMVMSIVERTREIGVLKSLGADERDIRLLFLVESGAIGGIGAAIGILFGWLITRLVSIIAKTIMENQSIDPVELFALPLWLILIAFVFGLTVSLFAGLYPASRAARIDPVEALRNE